MVTSGAIRRASVCTSLCAPCCTTYQSKHGFRLSLHGDCVSLTSYLIFIKFNILLSSLKQCNPQNCYKFHSWMFKSRLFSWNFVKIYNSDKLAQNTHVNLSAEKSTKPGNLVSILEESIVRFCDITALQKTSNKPSIVCYEYYVAYKMFYVI